MIYRILAGWNKKEYIIEATSFMEAYKILRTMTDDDVRIVHFIYN